MGMKLNSYQSVTETVVDIREPDTGNATGATVTLAGPTHPARKRFEYAVARRMQKQLAKTGRVDLGDPEDRETEAVEKLVECTLGWTGVQDSDGNDIPFSKDRARELYSADSLRWLRDVLLKALDEDERFIRRSVPG